jgi:hypothetical protein
MNFKYEKYLIVAMIFALLASGCGAAKKNNKLTKDHVPQQPMYL